MRNKLREINSKLRIGCEILNTLPNWTWTPEQLLAMLCSSHTAAQGCSSTATLQHRPRTALGPACSPGSLKTNCYSVCASYQDSGQVWAQNASLPPPGLGGAFEGGERQVTRRDFETFNSEQQLRFRFPSNPTQSQTQPRSAHTHPPAWAPAAAEQVGSAQTPTPASAAGRSSTFPEQRPLCHGPAFRPPGRGPAGGPSPGVRAPTPARVAREDRQPCPALLPSAPRHGANRTPAAPQRRQHTVPRPATTRGAAARPAPRHRPRFAAAIHTGPTSSAAPRSRRPPQQAPSPPPTVLTPPPPDLRPHRPPADCPTQPPTQPAPQRPRLLLSGAVLGSLPAPSLPQAW